MERSEIPRKGESLFDCPAICGNQMRSTNIHHVLCTFKKGGRSDDYSYDTSVLPEVPFCRCSRN